MRLSAHPQPASFECSCGEHRAADGLLPMGWTARHGACWCPDCTRSGAPPASCSTAAPASAGGPPDALRRARPLPYDHGSLARNNTSNPRAWHLANKAHFDASMARNGPGTTHRICEAERAGSASSKRAPVARDNKPRFDALYGPEGTC
jgi:hypothetical protein